MLLELMKRIRDEFTSSRLELISQIDISEEEYGWLLTYVREKTKISHIPTIASADEVLSVAMVQIAIKVYSDGNYWDCFNEEIGFVLTPPKKAYFSQIFVETIRKYEMFELRSKNDLRQAYVENIKAHAFVPNKYLENYFDFLFSFYDRNLLRNLTEDIDEDIDDLISFVSDSLNKSGDEVSIEKSGSKPAKSYKLLKATRSLIAQSGSTVLSDIFFDHLVMMDDYYYDGKLPSKSNRFTEEFQKWVEKKNSEINTVEKATKKRKNKESFFQKPHFEINRQRGQAFLVIPSQKFRIDTVVSDVWVNVYHSGKKISQKLDIYRAYGVLVSEEKKILIDNIFDNYDVEISSKQSHAYSIPKKKYRIFDEDFDETSKLNKGQNYILVEKTLSVSTNVLYTYANLDFDLWDEYSYSEISDNSVIYIDGNPISLAGEFTDRPLFEKVSKEYVLLKDDVQLQTAFEHPIISFKIAKTSLARTRVFVNDEVFNTESDCNASIIILPGEKDVVGVSIDLNTILSIEDGVYQVKLDEPGKATRIITKYILITELRFRFSKPRYTFCKTAEIRVYGRYDISPLNSYQNHYGEYVVDLSCNEKGRFKLLFKGIWYDVIVPLKIFKFGFEKQWEHLRPDILWYSEMKNELYVSIPGATAVRAYLNKDEDNYVEGVQYEPNSFKLEISDFVQEVTESSRAISYLNVEYFDNQWRFITLYKIQRKAWIDNISLIAVGTSLAIDAKFQSRNPVVVKFFEANSNAFITEVQLKQGITLITEARKDGIYNIEEYEVVEDEFGFGDEYVLLGTIHKTGIIDNADLSSCKMQILDIFLGEERLSRKYKYTVFDIVKIGSNTYTGKMMYRKTFYGEGIKEKAKVLFESIRFEIGLQENTPRVLSLYVLEKGEIFIPYYDKKEQRLISGKHEIEIVTRDTWRTVPLNQVLKDKHRYNPRLTENFLPLYEDSTTYHVEFRRVK